MVFLMAFVYSTLAFNTAAFFPIPKPLLADTCLVLGFEENVTMYGVLPFLVDIFTIPEPTSPYSTEGIPEITSIDSTLLVDKLLVVTPFVSEKLALLESLAPSTSTAVPNEGLPASFAEPVLMEKRFLSVKSGFPVVPPGRSPEISETFNICTWSKVVLSIVLAVDALFSFSFAVTTTVLSVRLSSTMYAL